MAVRKTVLLARDCGDGAAHGSDKLLIIGGFGTYVMHRACACGIGRCDASCMASQSEWRLPPRTRPSTVTRASNASQSGTESIQLPTMPAGGGPTSCHFSSPNALAVSHILQCF